MDAFISHYGYNDDTGKLKVDDDRDRGLEKLREMLGTGAISQEYFDRELRAYDTRVEEREQRSWTASQVRDTTLTSPNWAHTFDAAAQAPFTYM